MVYGGYLNNIIVLIPYVINRDGSHHSLFIHLLGNVRHETIAVLICVIVELYYGHVTFSVHNVKYRKKTHCLDKIK